MSTEEQIKAILANDFWVTDHVMGDMNHYNLGQYLTNPNFVLVNKVQVYKESTLDKITRSTWAIDRLTYVDPTTQNNGLRPKKYTLVLTHKTHINKMWLGMDAAQGVSDAPASVKRQLRKYQPL